MVKLNNVTKKYGARGSEQTVLENFTLTLQKGAKALITGESGIGKTTILRILAGREKPDSGEFICNERIAIMFQEPRLLPWKTALENVRAALPKDKISLADKYLSAVGLDDSKHKFPHELSGGMAQRVALARLLAFAEADGSTLLLLDEPFSALDYETAAKMLNLIKDFSKDKTLLMVAHHLPDIPFADEIISL